MRKYNKDKTAKLNEKIKNLEKLINETTDAVESTVSKEQQKAKKTLLSGIKEELSWKNLLLYGVTFLAAPTWFKLLLGAGIAGRLIEGANCVAAKAEASLDNKIYSNTFEKLAEPSKEVTIKKMMIINKQKETIESLIERNEQIKNETQEIEIRFNQANNFLISLESESTCKM